jgi:periplasmic copper chaperone A
MKPVQPFFRSAMLGLALSAATLPLWAQTVKIDKAWVRGTVASQPATGAFMQLTADKNLRLVGVSSPVAGTAEIHEMAMDKDVMRMRQVTGLDLVAGQALELKPGGYHVMLMALKQPLKAGDTVPLTLVFEDSAKKRFNQEIKAPVTPLGGGNGPAKMHH